MITAANVANVYDLRGLSTDTKPIEKVGNGSTFLEIDTSKLFAFDEANKQWKEISICSGGGGGGGGSSVDMTLNGVTANDADFSYKVGIYAIASEAVGGEAKHVKSVEVTGGASFDVVYDDDTTATISIETDAETGDKRVIGCEGGIMFGIYFDGNGDDADLISAVEEYLSKY